ncbi:MAG: T9SS type A sorting domain-containing protein [Cyclobacteriaceae bacterium]
MSRTIIFIQVFVFLQGLSFGQTYLGNESILAGDGIIATNAALIDSSMIQTTMGSLSFEGNDTIYFHSSWELDSLNVEGSPVLAGTHLMIHQKLYVDGTITPTDPMQLILDTLAEVVNPNESFVNGALYQAGSGDKFYPLGKEGRYVPTYLFGLENTSEELVGLEVFNDALDLSSLSPAPDASEWWYWELTGNPVNATIQLPLLLEDMEGLNISELTILNTDTELTILTDLAGSVDQNNTSILSNKPISAGYILVGNMPEALGLDEIFKIAIFPNPFDDFITLESPVEKPKTVVIYDLKGAIYFRDSLWKKLQIDTSGWKSGFYLMTISDDAKTIYRKVVKVE